MNEFIVHHTSGEFLVRTNLDSASAAAQIEARWSLDIDAIELASPEDIKINEGQWTYLDSDV